MARTKIQGYVDRGGSSVSTAGFVSTTLVDGSFPGSTVSVYKAGTIVLATIYSTSGGGAQANPFTSDANAFYSFWTDEASVDITFSGTGIPAPYTLSSVSGGAGTGTTSSTVINVKEAPYGALGNGIADDSTAIQAAINAAAPTGGTVYFPFGIYIVNTELNVPSTARAIHLLGSGDAYTLSTGVTSIKAGAAIRSVLFMNVSYCDVSQMKLDGNRLATYGLLLRNCSFGTFTRVIATNALLDGISLDAVGLNDNNEFHSCWSWQNGTFSRTAGLAATYATTQGKLIAGTAATTNGGTTITFTSAPDLTTLGLRVGDWVRIGVASPDYVQISVVAATTITCMAFKKPANTRGGQDYAFIQGDGYHEAQWSDNNINRVIGGLWQANASGIVHRGILGGTDIGIQSVGNALFGMEIGYTDGATPVTGGCYVRSYFEGNTVAPFFIGAMFNTTILNPENSAGYQTSAGATGSGGSFVIDQLGIKAIGGSTIAGWSQTLNNASGGASPSLTLSDGTYAQAVGGIALADVTLGVVKALGRSVGEGIFASYTPALTASVGTFTATIVTARYAFVGKKMTLLVKLNPASVNNTPTILTVALPAGITAASSSTSAFGYSDNGVAGVGIVDVTAGATTINLLKSVLTPTWAISANNSIFSFTTEVEIQ